MNDGYRILLAFTISLSIHALFFEGISPTHFEWVSPKNQTLFIQSQEPLSQKEEITEEIALLEPPSLYSIDRVIDPIAEKKMALSARLLFESGSFEISPPSFLMEKKSPFYLEIPVKWSAEAPHFFYWKLPTTEERVELEGWLKELLIPENGQTAALINRGVLEIKGVLHP